MFFFILVNDFEPTSGPDDSDIYAAKDKGKEKMNPAPTCKPNEMVDEAEKKVDSLIRQAENLSNQIKLSVGSARDIATVRFYIILYLM